MPGYYICDMYLKVLDHPPGDGNGMEESQVYLSVVRQKTLSFKLDVSMACNQ